MILEPEQSNIFWEKTRCLEVFSGLKYNLLRIVVPASETFEVINKIKIYESEYFIDWGGNLIWLQIDKISAKILKNIKEIVSNASGYLTAIKIEENLKASIDVFTIDPIKYKLN